MSFPQKGFWMPGAGGFLTDEDMAYDNSSQFESKRGTRWLMDTINPELLSNKKQAIGDVSPVIGNSPIGLPWHDDSSIHPNSSQFTNFQFGSERHLHVVNRNIPFSWGGDGNSGTKCFSNLYSAYPSIDSFMTNNIVDDPLRSIWTAGIGSIKVNEVKDSKNDNYAPIQDAYRQSEDNTILTGARYNKNDGNNLFLGPTYGNGNEDAVSAGATFSKTDNDFILMGHSFNILDANFTLMDQNYKEDENVLSVGQPFDKADANFIASGSSNDKEDSNVIVVDPSYGEGHDNLMTLGGAYGGENEKFVSIGLPQGKEDNNIIPTQPTYDKGNFNFISADHALDKGKFGILAIGQNYSKGDNNGTTFEAFPSDTETNTSGILVDSYCVSVRNLGTAQTSEVSAYQLPHSSAASSPNLMTTVSKNKSARTPKEKENTAQTLAVPVHNNLPHSNASIVADNASSPSSMSGTSSKNKVAKALKKKAASNNFPSNVKSLLSTGMFDGVHVKYFSWSREHSLTGVIQGTGYLCGCTECNFSKTVNAFEFETHAGCKTKHPNSHIYFENGKTIYTVVQELKSTPQEELFDVIQNVTGSQINQRNFSIWKESYKAATVELQRIYGKKEFALASS